MNITTPDNASLEELVGRIAGEFTERVNRGERPSVGDYVDQHAREHPEHPDLAAELRKALEVAEMLKQPAVEAALADGDPYMAAPLGDFLLIRKIDKGGMGIVYEARQLSLKRTVAVKVLPAAATLDPRSLQRFKIEVKAAASLNHEHIVPVHCIGCERGIHFYAMKCIEGMSLAAFIKEVRRRAGLEPNDPEQTAPHLHAPAGQDTAPAATLTTEGAKRSPEYFLTVARLGLEAAQGLAHAHAMGVRHRDIKPGNLLVDNNGKLWITDFGLAQMRSDAAQTQGGDDPLTERGQLIGTVRYMSPEQAVRVPVDERSDIYSLGATLYELLALEPVFQGDDRDELLRQIVSEDPRPLRSHNRSIPRDLETIVHKALAKAPARRYPSAAELAMDLQRFWNNEPIKARPEGRLRWLGRKARRHANGIFLGLSAVITTVVLVLFVLQVNQPAPEPPTPPEVLEERRQQAALAALTKDLDQGKKVTLIGATGRPGYFKWRTDKAAGKFMYAPDGEFKVRCWEHGLIELLPDPRLPRYRFRAEVRHEQQTFQESRVGIYFGHSEQPHLGAVAHFHCNVAFNDLFDVIMVDPKEGYKGNLVGLQAHRQSWEGRAHYTSQVYKADLFFRPAIPVGALGPWREIAVELRPNTIKLFWEGECYATTPRAVLMRDARPLVARPDQDLPANAPQYPPRGGLGLFVSLGTASFRNVTVEPISEDN